MLRPARMLHLNVLVLDSDVDRATSQLIRCRLVHLVSVTDLEPWADESGLQTVEDDDSRAFTEVERLARSIAEKLAPVPEVLSQGTAFQPFDPHEDRKTLERIATEVNSIVTARDLAAQNLAALREATSQATRDFRQKFGIAVGSRYTLLELVLGRLPEKSLDLFKRLLSDVPNVVLTFPEEKGSVALMAIVLKKDRDLLRKAADEVGLERTPVTDKKAPLPDELMEHLEERIHTAKEELDRARSAVDRCRAAHLPFLQKVLSQISFQKLTRVAKSRFRKTARTYLISGWTPRHSRQKVIEGLRKACGDRCLIEVQRAEELLSQHGERVDVPIVFENPKVLKPFEMLVANYGRPAYNSIDPTIVVAPTFLFMYGAMFGDVGQGVVMAILGALVSRWKKASGIRRVGQLLMWCGSSAVLFGLLYGSVFGFRNVLPYRGFEPIEKVSALLTIALFFGMGMISLGLVFSAVSAITRKEWAAGLFDWKGLMGLAFYWLGVALAIGFIGGRTASPTLVAVLIAMPFVAALLKAPIEKLSHPRMPGPEGGMALYAVRSVGHMLGESFETVLTFFTNTLSFLRVAAFAIAHAGLFIAVFSLADVMKGGGPALPIVIHILGNAGMIALEGLVVTVQALRLEYYEFFGKFFRAGGTAFAPLKLPSTVP